MFAFKSEQFLNFISRVDIVCFRNELEMSFYSLPNVCTLPDSTQLIQKRIYIINKLKIDNTKFCQEIITSFGREQLIGRISIKCGNSHIQF